MDQSKVELIKKAHLHAILAIIFWLLIITFIIGFIFQILLVLDLLKLDAKDLPDRQLLLILAIIGIFYAGWILNILIAYKLRVDTYQYVNKANRNLPNNL